ncbi:DUF1842 domain-containing protein [Chromobacterium alticapitis]|uniref:DUF1842 domain-containing protein n=1 Tax=Chromobacterium alticapitis TaxID=2073169 RepID=A0A2S5DAX4_9NEIS|nr:DUF1842 domain-containing protein [Chromobacterium alticapitis]POZ60236.1 hypothetical protein C2I19_19965 [Chromobacterium alticapitis]
MSETTNLSVPPYGTALQQAQGAVGHPQDGLFPVSYIITTGAAGAQNLALTLLVNTVSDTVVGFAKITQAVTPSAEPPFTSDVWGQYTYLTVMPPSDGRILVTAQGNHGGPHANSPVNFKIELLLDRSWTEGTANYSYFNGQAWISLENVPAKLNRELGRLPVSHKPGHPIMPMYAVAIQSAVAKNDSAEISRLKSAAEQQRDSLVGAVRQLKEKFEG